MQKTPGTLFLFEFALGQTIVLWVVPLLRDAYRLYKHVRQTVPAGWRRVEVELSQELPSDWMQQVRELGFNLAGCLAKDRQSQACVALFVNSESGDSADVSRLADQNFLVFKTRFSGGFAFETGNTTTARIVPGDPAHSVFKVPRAKVPADLYRVHKCTRKRFETERKTIISNAEGEIAEFIWRAETVVCEHPRTYACSPHAELCATPHF